LCRPQVEKAGGYSSADGKQMSSLDVPIEAYDQRTQVWLLFDSASVLLMKRLCGAIPPHLLCPAAQVCYGSEGEVRRFEEYM
jgi:hypothetical protein